MKKMKSVLVAAAVLVSARAYAAGAPESLKGGFVLPSPGEFVAQAKAASAEAETAGIFAKVSPLPAGLRQKVVRAVSGSCPAAYSIKEERTVAQGERYVTELSASWLFDGTHPVRIAITAVSDASGVLSVQDDVRGDVCKPARPASFVEDARQAAEKACRVRVGELTGQGVRDGLKFAEFKASWLFDGMHPVVVYVTVTQNPDGSLSVKDDVHGDVCR